MASPTIIAFVGMPGSGKGTCTDYMADVYGFPVIHFGNMVYEEVQRRGLHNVKDEKFVKEDMRQKEGPAVLAIRAAEKLELSYQRGHASLYWMAFIAGQSINIFTANLQIQLSLLHSLLPEQNVISALSTVRTLTALIQYCQNE